MTTLAANKPRTYEGGPVRITENHYPVIAAQTIFEGCAVGIVDATGLAQKLVFPNRFGGFAVAKADNSAGAASAINVDIITKGYVQLAVSGAVITDVGQPVYATDDDTFVLSPVSGVFVGFVDRFVSAGVAIVSFDTAVPDPWQAWSSRLAIAVNTTLDETHTGKLIWVTADATVTLPVIATGLDGVAIVNGGAFGTVVINISPNAADKIMGPGITSADDKDLINTKATARRGDFAVIGGNDADGYGVQMLRGTWAREA